MTVSSYKMGPGTLKLGVSGAEDVSCQVRSCTVAPSENVDTEDAIDVLCGEQIPEEDTVSLTWELSGSMQQDLGSSGVVAYTWTHASEWLDFEFIPNTAAARKVTGQVRIIPLGIGGDVKTKPASDFTWVARGPAAAANPVFAAAT